MRCQIALFICKSAVQEVPMTTAYQEQYGLNLKEVMFLLNQLAY